MPVCMYVRMYCKNVDINVFECMYVCMYVCIKVTHRSCRALLGQLGLLGSQAAHTSIQLERFARMLHLILVKLLFQMLTPENIYVCIQCMYVYVCICMYV